MKGMYPKLESIIHDSMDIWAQFPGHPFLQGLADGTLDDRRFLHYLIQDTLYLREYARVFAMAMYRAERMEEIRMYYSLLSFVNENESSFRLQKLAEAGLCSAEVDDMPFRPENRAYCDFMLEIARKHGVIEIMMAVLPCMLSYAWIFEKLVESTPHIRESRYWSFIEGYISKDYAEDCRRWAAFTEARIGDMGEDDLQRLSGIFRSSSLHEAHFWDMSYQLD